MPKLCYKLKSIEFNSNKFRKINNMKINIAPRLTAISGHNGIGKSTILGIIANASGYSGDPKSYFGKSFQSEFRELFHLDESEVVTETSQKPRIELEYTIDIQEPEETNEIIIIKSCSVSLQEQSRLRLIPRTTTQTRNIYGEELSKYGIGNDAKMPIPTLYLGMSRMTPIGEYNSDDITITKRRDGIDQKDQKYIIEKTNEIITSDLANNPGILSHQFKHSKKGSSLPEHNHSSLTISLGQDSLSSIITALASFRKIKREQGNFYAGGILVIDELDAGFHPIAQRKLIRLFKKEARNLNLQIIFTTHSLTIIKDILNEDQENQDSSMDTVIYLQDTRLPKLMESVSYQKIKNDLLLTPKESAPKRKTIDIYFEDDEARYYFENLLKYTLNGESTYDKFGVEFEHLPLGAADQVLMTLYNSAPYFQSQLLIPDNDVMSKETNRRTIEEANNIVPLPGNDTFSSSTQASNRTPETILYNFIKDKLDNWQENEDFWKEISVTTDYVEGNILTLEHSQLTGARSRDCKKTWFNSCVVKQFFEDNNIINLWAQENPNSVNDFINKLQISINYVLAITRNNC